MLNKCSPNQFLQNLTDVDNSFMRNVPEREESAFNKQSLGKTKQTSGKQKPCNYLIVSSSSTGITNQLPQPNSNQAVAEDEVEDSMSDEQTVQPYMKTKSLRLYAKQPQLYQNNSQVKNNQITDRAREHHNDDQRDTQSKINSYNKALQNRNLSQNNRNDPQQIFQKQRDNSAANSEQMSVNIKYDSFREERSKFKINTIHNNGPVGTLAESKQPKLHHQMVNLQRISNVERKALGVFNEDQSQYGNDLHDQNFVSCFEIANDNQYLDRSSGIRNQGMQSSSNIATSSLFHQQSAFHNSENQYLSGLSHQDYRQIIDVKCQNCGKFLEIGEAEEHSRKCQRMTGGHFESKLRLYLQKKQDLLGDVNEANENILKIQEAIFERLSQIDQQFEEVLSVSKYQTDQKDTSLFTKLSSGKQTLKDQYDKDFLPSEQDNSNQLQKQSSLLQLQYSHISNKQNITRNQFSAENNQSIAYSDKAILDNLNYFIDQFTNLHAVCNKALEIDESTEELQLVLNVLNQDLEQIEEQASLESFLDVFNTASGLEDPNKSAPYISQDNIEQVKIEQRHRQLINFAKRIMFSIIQKLNIIESIDKINDCILLEKRREIHSKQDALSNKSVNEFSNLLPQHQSNQNWRYLSVYSSNSNQPSSSRSQRNIKSSNQIRHKEKNLQNTDRGEFFEGVKINHSDIEFNIEDILNDSKVLLTNISRQQPQEEQSFQKIEHNPKRVQTSLHVGNSDKYFKFPASPQKTVKGKWQNEITLQSTVIEIEVNDRVDKGVVDINICQKNKQKLRTFEQYAADSNKAEKQLQQERKADGHHSQVQCDYLDKLLQLDTTDPNFKHVLSDQKSSNSALERDSSYQLFQVNNQPLHKQHTQSNSGKRGMKLDQQKGFERQPEMLSPLMKYQEQQFDKAKKTNDAIKTSRATPKKLKFQRTFSSKMSNNQMDSVPNIQNNNQISIIEPKKDLQQIQNQDQNKNNQKITEIPANIRNKSVQDYKNTFLKFLQNKKKDKNQINDQDKDSLCQFNFKNTQDNSQVIETKPDTKLQQQNQLQSNLVDLSEKPKDKAKDKEKDKKFANYKYQSDFGNMKQKLQKDKTNDNKPELKQSIMMDFSLGSSRKRDSNAEMKSYQLRERQTNFMDKTAKNTSPLMAEFHSKPNNKTHGAKTTKKNSSLSLNANNQEQGRPVRPFQDQPLSTGLRQTEKSPAGKLDNKKSKLLKTPISKKEDNMLMASQEPNSTLRKQDKSMSMNVSSVSPMPRRSRKINIADYGYSNQQLEQARNSVDRLIGGSHKFSKDFNTNSWIQSQKLKSTSLAQLSKSPIQIMCQKQQIDLTKYESEKKDKLLELENDNKIEEEKQSELEQSLLWDGLVSQTKNSQVPTLQSDNIQQIDSTDQDLQKEQESQLSIKEQPDNGDSSILQNQAPTNEQQQEPRLSSKSRKNLFAKKGKLNKSSSSIGLSDDDSNSKGQKQFLPKKSHGKDDQINSLVPQLALVEQESKEEMNYQFE